MRQQNRKTPLVLYIGLILMSAVLITSCMMGGLYARYTTTVAGSASATVAKFDVVTECVYDAGENQYILTITNNSDVTVSYSVVGLVDGEAFPNGVSITDIKDQNLVSRDTATHNISVTEAYNEYHPDLMVDLVVTVEQVD